MHLPQNSRWKPKLYCSVLGTCKFGQQHWRYHRTSALQCYSAETTVAEAPNPGGTIGGLFPLPVIQSGGSKGPMAEEDARRDLRGRKGSIQRSDDRVVSVDLRIAAAEKHCGRRCRIGACRIPDSKSECKRRRSTCEVIVIRFVILYSHPVWCREH